MDLSRGLANMGAEQPVHIRRAAATLAREHAEDDAGMLHIISLRHPEEIRLIEVTHSVRAAGEVLPFRFVGEPEIPCKYVVVQLHPDDWKRLDDLAWPPEMDPRHRPEGELDVVHTTREFLFNYLAFN